VRSLIVCTALLLFGNGAYGDGIYQPTKDGTVLVWNNDPKPKDAATWSGKRDRDGYATGYGTLIWYRVAQKILTGSSIPVPKYIPVSRYSGNMVQGKLDGPVATVDRLGRTFHATFTEGSKNSDWAAGPAPRPDQQRNEIVPRAELVEAPAEGPSRIQKSELSGQRSEITDGQATQQHVAKPAVTETPNPAIDSLRSLTGPTSSLRMNAGAEPPSREATASEGASLQGFTSSAVASAPPRLTTAEVIGLADANARTQGYDLGEYQRPQVNYVPADDIWSVVYQKFIKSTGEIGEHFSVKVEDKTKKTSIVTGR